MTTFTLADRTGTFARRVRTLLRQLPIIAGTVEDSKQLFRSSGSVAANYLEADEAVSKKDFIYRMKICRKEIKESRLWLQLIFTGGNVLLEKERQSLIQESKELLYIFSAIIQKAVEKNEKRQ